jgi:outer membrane protein insertion porin family
VAIRIEVVENVRTVVNSVSLEGNTSVPAEELTAGLLLGPGEPFSAGRLALDRDAIELRYANRGFQNVSVETRPGLSGDRRAADVVFTVREGPRMFVDHVLIVGNDRTRTETIERELRFRSGDPLGLEAISESQRRLAALGLFRRARITQLGRSDQTRRDVLVSVDEAPLTTIGYGGGVEVRRRIVRASDDPRFASETIEFAPRATFEVGRRNLFGTNRSVNLFTSGSLHNRSSAVFANQPELPVTASTEWGFPQYRVVGQFRQPRIRGSNADFRVTGTLEQQIRSSFNFRRSSASAELAMRLSPRVSVSGGYQIQRNRVFNQSSNAQQNVIDRLFPTVRLSSFVASILRDTRDDPVDPTTGQFFTANGQLAAQVIGSEVSYVKTFMTAQSFRTLPGARGIVFANSVRVGSAVGFRNATGARDLPSSERFFAGGDTTVRGFTLDRLGVRHVPPESSDTIDQGGFPLGGNGLLIFNGELRVPLRAGVRVVGFADVGQVYRTMSDVRVTELRPALGFGFRYKSPVGPLRFDMGVKVPRRYDEARTAWFITFGEAF